MIDYIERFRAIIIIIIIKKDKFYLPWASFKDRLQSQ